MLSSCLPMLLPPHPHPMTLFPFLQPASKAYSFFFFNFILLEYSLFTRLY